MSRVLLLITVHIHKWTDNGVDGGMKTRMIDIPVRKERDADRAGWDGNTGVLDCYIPMIRDEMRSYSGSALLGCE